MRPAGHVLGSAQLHCELSGRSVVYAGDLGGSGARAPATAEPREQVACDVLLLRATYGHPRYAFPPRAEVLQDLSRFVTATLRERRTPIVLAAPLGGAQEAVRHLGEHELRLHAAPLRFCEVYRAQGVELPPTLPLGVAKPGQVVVLPAHPRSRRLVPDFEPYRVCLLSGRAAEPGFAAQIGVDVALPLSDHAGFPDLLDYAVRSGASRVIVVHGNADELIGSEFKDAGHVPSWNDERVPISQRDSIWKGQAWSVTWKHVLDSLIYAVVTVATFGWLWPR